MCYLTGGANEQGEAMPSPTSMYYPQGGYMDHDMGDQMVPQDRDFVEMESPGAHTMEDHEVKPTNKFFRSV